MKKTWLPSKHIELTARAAYHSNLHLLAFFNRPMARILPSNVQEWVTMATAQGLAPRSVRKYRTWGMSRVRVRRGPQRSKDTRREPSAVSPP